MVGMSVAEKLPLPNPRRLLAKHRRRLMRMTNGKLLNKYGKSGDFPNNTIIRDGSFNDDTTCVHTKRTTDVARRQQKRIFQGICPGWHFVFNESFPGMSADGVVDERNGLDAIGT